MSLDQGAVEGSDVSNEGQETESTEQQAVETPAEVGRKFLEKEMFGNFVKFKVDGEEVELPLSEVIKGYQLDKASYNKMQEAAQIKAKAKQLIEFAENSPEQLLKALGKDPMSYAEEYLARQLEEQMMSEEDRKIRDERKELEELRAERKRFQEQQEQEKIARAEQEYSQKLDKEMAEAFSKSSLPRHKFFIQQVASQMLGAATRGEELPVAEAIARVEEAVNGYLPSMLQTLPTETLVKWLGKDGRKRLREFDLSELGVKQEKTKSPEKSASPSFKTASWGASNRGKPLTEKEYKAWKESLNSKE